MSKVQMVKEVHRMQFIRDLQTIKSYFHKHESQIKRDKNQQADEFVL